MKKILLISLLASFSTVFSFNTAEYTSAKVMGLGGAYTAIANDEMALFYNPAGLAYIDSGMLGHINVEGTFAFDDSFTDIIDTISKYNNDFGATSNLLTNLNGKSGSTFYGGGLSYFTKGISLGAFSSMKVFQKYYNDRTHVDVNRTSLVCMGFATRLQENLAAGITLKALRLEAIKGDLLYSDLDGSEFDGMNFGDDDFDTRFSLGANVGAMYRVGAFGFGASVENIFTLDAANEDSDGSIVSVNSAEAPEPVLRLGVGFATGPTLLAADVANILDADNTTYHLGIQQKLLDIPFLNWLGGVTARAGYLSGKKDGIDITASTIGAQARLLITYLNVNVVEKEIGGNKSQEFNFSGQISF